MSNRGAASAVLLLAAAIAYCQPASGRFDPGSVEPDIAVSVERIPTGTDMVRVTAMDAQYPPDLLREQIARLGERLGVEPRGVNVRYESIGETRQHVFLEATFVVEGLIDRSAAELNLDPIVDAFLGAPEPYRTEAMMVTFHGESASASTLKAHEDEFVHVEGTSQASPPSIAYRIVVYSQDPDAVIIPSSVQPDTGQERAANRGSGSSRTLILVLLAVGGLSAGVLVYFTLLWALDRK